MAEEQKSGSFIKPLIIGGIVAGLVGIGGYFAGAKRMESKTVDMYVDSLREQQTNSSQFVYGNDSLAKVVADKDSQIAEWENFWQEFSEDLDKKGSATAGKNRVVYVSNSAPGSVKAIAKQDSKGNNVIYLPSVCSPETLIVEKKVEVVRKPTDQELAVYAKNTMGAKEPSKFDDLKGEDLTENAILDLFNTYFSLVPEGKFPLRGYASTPCDEVYDNFLNDLSKDMRKGKLLTSEEKEVWRPLVLRILDNEYKWKVQSGGQFDTKKASIDDFCIEPGFDKAVRITN